MFKSSSGPISRCSAATLCSFSFSFGSAFPLGTKSDQDAVTWPWGRLLAFASAAEDMGGLRVKVSIDMCGGESLAEAEVVELNFPQPKTGQNQAKWRILHHSSVAF